MKLKLSYKAVGRLWDGAREVCNILYNAGKECYAVGGAVRDLVMGREPHDIDLATNARPNEVKEIFSKAGCKTIPTGEKYGTITVTCDGSRFYEVTTFRGEKYRRGSRKPIVTFSDSILEDLERRDFTINAMAYDFRDDTIIDPFGGIEDIRKGVIRAVGDPDKRFLEDPLRIFRMCRFSSIYGFKIDKGTFNAAKRKSGELKWVSMERKVEETKKAFFKSDKPSMFVECLVDTGAMMYMIPELYKTVNVDQPPPHRETVYEHTLIALDNTPKDFVTRMAVLLHDIGKPDTKRDTKPFFPKHAEVGAKIAENIVRRLKLSRDEMSSIVNLVRNHDFLLSNNVNSDRDARRILLKLARNGLSRRDIERLLEIVEADTKATLGLPREKIVRVWDSIERIRKWLPATPLDRRELAISGNDLLSIGVEPRKMNKIFNKLLEWVVDDPSRNNRDELIMRARILAKSMGALKGKRRL